MRRLKAGTAVSEVERNRGPPTERRSEKDQASPIISSAFMEGQIWPSNNLDIINYVNRSGRQHPCVVSANFSANDFYANYKFT